MPGAVLVVPLPAFPAEVLASTEAPAGDDTTEPDDCTAVEVPTARGLLVVIINPVDVCTAVISPLVSVGYGPL